MQPGDLLDQVDLALEVGPPAGHVHRDPAVLRLGYHRRADGDEILLDRVPGQLDAEHLGHARGAKEDARRVGGPGPEIERRVGQLAAGGREDDLDAAAHRVAPAPAVDAALEAVARLGAEAERAAGAADPAGIPVGALEQDVAGLVAHLGARRRPSRPRAR